MLMRAKIDCPNCEGTHCRQSRWLSLEEKRRNPESRPYRCQDCSHRFLAQKSAAVESNLTVSVPVALAAVLVTAMVAFGLASVSSSSAPSPTVKSTVIDPDVLKAAEMGDTSAQYRVGEALFLDPEHNKETSAKAVRWLQLSAENGNTDAMVLLGRLSRSGVGILQNFGQSAKWIQTAANRGDMEGMLEMGRLYRDGVGLERNLVQSYIWFNRAAAAHNLEAVREREAVARLLTADELKTAQNQSSAVHAGGDSKKSDADGKKTEPAPSGAKTGDEKDQKSGEPAATP